MRTGTAWSATVAGGLSLFGMLAILLLTGGASPVDEAGFVWAGVASGPAAVTAATALGEIGNLQLLAPLLAGCLAGLLLARRYAAAATLLIGFVATDLLVLLLKAAFARARPETALLLAGGYSFPSGHAARAAVLALFAIVALYRLRVPWRVPLALLAGGWAISMAWARVVLHVHHMTDVVAGAALGLGVGAAALALHDRWTASWFAPDHVEMQAEDFTPLEGPSR